MLSEMQDIKKQMEPIVHDANIKLNLIAREVITRKKEYEIYGPMIDRIYLDNAIYVKVMTGGRDAKSDKVDIKNGFYMVFVAPEKGTTQEIKNKLKIAFTAFDDKFIKDLIRLYQRFREILNRTQNTLAKSSNMDVVIETNLGETTSNIKFVITIKYSLPGQKLGKDNVKSAGSFRDMKNVINLIVDKSTPSAVCDKLLDDVERYFIGEH